MFTLKYYMYELILNHIGRERVDIWSHQLLYDYIESQPNVNLQVSLVCLGGILLRHTTSGLKWDFNTQDNSFLCYEETNRTDLHDLCLF